MREREREKEEIRNFLEKKTKSAAFPLFVMEAGITKRSREFIMVHNSTIK